jgi:sugar lactone lactonase YvrE
MPRMHTHIRGFLIVLALAAAADARPGVLCDKNHYILDEPCGVVATEAAIYMPGAVAVDGNGNVYFSGPNIVYKIDGAGVLTREAGSGRPGFSGDGGQAREALLNFPAADYAELDYDPFDFVELLGPLALDAAGNLYIGDAYNNRVRRVDSDGIITTVAGSGRRGGFGIGPIAGDGVSATSATLWWPQGLAIDPLGHLLIADSTGTLLKVLDDGTLAALTANDCGAFGAPGLCAPEGIAVNASGDVFVADGYCRVRMVGPAGDVQTVAGGACGYSNDGGPATSAGLSYPFGVAVDAAGNLFIADTYNHCVRKVGSDGLIVTVAGQCGRPGNAPPTGSALDGGLRTPHGVAVDSMGNLYIADSGNNRIRKVTADGLMTTIGGNGYGDLVPSF